VKEKLSSSSSSSRGGRQLHFPVAPGFSSCTRVIRFPSFFSSSYILKQTFR